MAFSTSWSAFMHSRHLSLCLVLLLCAGCRCSSELPVLAPLDGGSVTDAGTSSGTIRIDPRDPELVAHVGQQAPTLQLTALADGVPVQAAWSLDDTSAGTVDSSGLFTASGNPGSAVVTATYGTASDTTTVRVRLEMTDNGAPDAGTPDGGGAGGWGGVGGEGIGGPVNELTGGALAKTPQEDPGLSFLYPYDGTVWPRGILAPLLQWAPGGHDYDAVSIRLECDLFSYQGTFARTATPFLHHPVPQEAWRLATETCAGKDVQVRVVLAAEGEAWGPLTETWHVASGFLKGVIYYNSYGTRLAENYTGALGGDGRFGGATLAIRGGSTDPALVAGGNGGVESCRVCHVVSANGATMLAQRGDVYAATSSYSLTNGNAETRMGPEDGRFAWAAITPDGTLGFSNSAPVSASSSMPSFLFEVPSGAVVPSTGLPAGLRAGTPVFSHDGSAIAFNWYGGDVDGLPADQRSLAMMKRTPPGTFSGFARLFAPPAGQTALYPSFTPTGAGVVFQLETVWNGRSFGETRSTCDQSGPCSDVGTRAELW
jgi:hypothetical protein